MGDYVLVVDDSPDVRRLILEVIDTMGVVAKEAINGQQALAMVDQDMPRVIILDLMMPVMNGFTLITQLHSRKPGQPIPVILLSGVADDHQMKSLPGVVGVLRKGSFSIDELSAVLRVALAKSEPAPETSPEKPTTP